MRGAKKRQALPAIVLLLLASAPPPPGAEGRDVPATGAERGALLDLLLQALGDDGRPLPPRPPRRDRVISRRYSGGAPPPDPRPITAAAAAPRQPPAVRGKEEPPRCQPRPPGRFLSAFGGVEHCRGLLGSAPAGEPLRPKGGWGWGSRGKRGSLGLTSSLL